MMSEPVISHYALPGILADIARATRIEVAVAVARTYGGRRLYIPRQPKRDHSLSKLVGHRAALIICRTFGSERHDIPSARTYLRWYDARILRAEGKSMSAISRQIGVGIKQVQTLLAGFEPGVAPATSAASIDRRCILCGRRHRSTTLRHADTRQMVLL